jgi:hypothetical protein
LKRITLRRKESQDIRLWIGTISGDRGWMKDPFTAEAMAAAHFLGLPAWRISAWIFWMAQMR